MQLRSAKTSVGEFLDNQEWLLRTPDSRIDRVAFACDRASGESSLVMEDFRFSASEDLVDARGIFYVIRDDLLHPTVGGNKMRKLDAVIPFLKAQLVTDVVTCGGCQSAHAAAVAVVCSEHGMKAHLLLRGEQLTVPTGYNLISAMYGNVTLVPRSEYADRETMLRNHAERVAASGGSVLRLNTASSTRSREARGKHVALVEEGAGDALALLGLIRLIAFLLATPDHFSPDEKIQIVVDTGTGTTAVGLAVGIALFALPWEVIGVMLADTREGYEQQREKLVSDFVRQFELGEQSLDHLNLVWQEREHRRKFGAVLKGEISGCKKIARETGILLDPIYTLAAWETSVKLSFEAQAKVVMLHTGGTLGLFGLAQRYPAEFTSASSE